MATLETVTEIIDGDSFKTRERPVSIRLADVYAPELGNPGSVAATRELHRLVSGRTVVVFERGMSYGRVVADVTVNGSSVNNHMQNFLRG